MEKNRTKYGLMAALIGIWGLVAYRFYQRANPNFDLPQDHAFQEEASDGGLVQDSFSLLLTYGNPFSMAANTASQQKPFTGTALPKATIPTPPKPPVPKPEPKPIVFPEIAYKGNIRLKSGRSAALVSIGGSIANLGIGETLNEVTLFKIFDDSIKVKFQKTEKVIVKARQ